MIQKCGIKFALDMAVDGLICGRGCQLVMLPCSAFCYLSPPQAQARVGLPAHRVDCIVACKQDFLA